MGIFSKIKNIFKKEEEETPIIDEVIEKEESNQVKEKVKEEIQKVKEEPKEEAVVEEKKIDKESVKIYEKGLTRTRENFVSRLINLTNKYNKITEEYFDELEEILIMADIGVNTVMSFMDRLRDRVKKEKIEDLEYLKEVIVDELFIIYVNDEIIASKINEAKNPPTVILFVGVNGVGKTTTIAKLASKYHDGCR